MGKSSGGGGGGSDYGSMFSAIAAMQAAEKQYQLGMNQLNWAKEVYGEFKPYMLEGTRMSLDEQRAQNEFAGQQRDFYTNTYQPLEEDYVERVQNWDTPERREQMAGQAQSMVASQYEQARSAAQQQLESYGVDPSSTRYAALDLGTRVAQAASAAGAGTKAIQDVENTGMALRSGAINTGRGYPGAVANTSSSGTSAGGTGMGSLNNFFGTSSQAMTAPVAWFNAGNQSMGNAISAWNNSWDNSHPQKQGGSSGIGSALGMVGGIVSQFLEDGGAVEGGSVPIEASPTEGAAIDDVPARLSVGEYVVPEDVVSWKGEEFFQKLINQSRQAKEGATAKPSHGVAPAEDPTFVSQGALPVG